MSRIELEQISDNEIEVVLPPETPMEMVAQLTKGLNDRGLVEDLSKSTACHRFFYRPQSQDDVADKLIKSLQRLAKEDELPYWHPKSQFANQKRVRDMEIAERRAKNGIKQPSNVSTAPEPMVMPDAAPKMPATPSVTAGSTMTPAAPSFPKMFDNTPAAMNTAGGTGRRYATISDPTMKAEHVEGCQCDKCLEMNKSNYGPKGAGQYSAVDNARRKANNTSDKVGVGPNVNAKQYTSAKFSNATPQTDPKLKKPQPVKQMGAKDLPANVAADILNRANSKMKKSWGQHLPFPSAEDEIMKLAKNDHVDGETAAANQLAALMSGKQMLGENVHPAVKAMMAPPPPQPTNEQLFGGGVVTEEMAKAAEHKWHNTFNNWMQEASKPIAQRFASEEEELAYWANIKVSDRDDGSSGY